MFRVAIISKHGEIGKIFEEVLPDDKGILWTALVTARGQKWHKLAKTFS